MTHKALNIEKEAYLLTGKERARLVIKDAHEKAFGDKKGFLTDTERNALIHITNPTVSEEYNQYWELYQKTPIIMGLATETYLRFKYFYESLKKAHLLLNLSPAIECLSEIIEDEIKDEKKKKDALKIIDLIQTIQISDDGKLRLKDNLNFIKESVPKIYKLACDFISIKKIIEEINEELGFNVFIGKRYNEIYQIYIEEVNLLIKEHNRIMKERAGDLEDLKDYLIDEPTYKTEFYEEWENYLFKGKSKDE